MSRLHSRCEQNVPAGQMLGKVSQCLQCTQHVPTEIQVPSPPVSEDRGSLARTTMLESANTEGAASRRVARFRGMEVRSVDSVTGRGSGLRRFEGSADTSGLREVSDIARKSAESLLKMSGGSWRRLRRDLANTGKRVAKIGRTAAKMKNPMAATKRTIAGII